MTEPHYTEQTTWTFKPCGKHDVWEVTGYDDFSISFEECRKNGQEDTHMSGYAKKQPDGSWKITDGREQIETYGGSNDVAFIEYFFDKHGPPSKL